MNRDNSRRGVNQSSCFLPLDASIRTMKSPSRDNEQGDRGSDEDINGEAQKSEDDVDDENEEETFMSIGVDFGTTLLIALIAFLAWLGRSRHPLKRFFIVSNWDTDEANDHDLEKVPSIVTRNSQGKVNSWGFSLEERRHHISWFKLGLCEEVTKMLAKERPERYNMLYDLLAKYDKKPLDVSADYLRLLWAHSIEHIQEEVDPVLRDNIKLRIVLTVPAIWDHKAQDLTRRAAEMAGMLDREDSTLELIAEPEAAALAVFTGMNTSRTQSSLRISHAQLLCTTRTKLFAGSETLLLSVMLEEAQL
ncbi:MAG: hypothetical protein M1818_004224 [Claussenomyces sp. TS43310]|nr:MAG: hypothetical protein M1818_004224 [Claussenomyces sp. TS43310]